MPREYVSGFQPGPVAQRIFYTDFEGNPGDPDDILADGLDGGWAEREPAAIELLNDESAHPADRLLACAALALWGSPAGYRAVIDAAHHPERVVWSDQSVDRWFGTDNTFALLAEEVGDSYEIAVERGTSELRREALAALVPLADRYQFERRLVQAMSTDDIRALAEEVDAVIGSGIDRIRRRDPMKFDLDTQIAGLIIVMHRVDQARAESRAMELVSAPPNQRALRELGNTANMATAPPANRLMASVRVDLERALELDRSGSEDHSGRVGHFGHAMETLVTLQAVFTTHDGPSAADLADFRYRIGSLVAANARTLHNYVYESFYAATDALVDGWLDPSLRRSAVQLLLDD
ncbi:hypothetical protein ACFYTQ_33515 [Nocardia sp. NPDC004068]|uniref:hypothetical protein n=1 Tax=Nocardia sp. NPDC004068 TaxID=3364303 RepID=UPI003682D8EB